jgi:hypothetical protein
MSIKVPAECLPELRPILLNWRREAKLLLESDLPSADQTPEIHGVCRVLWIKSPINTVEARATAEAWLLARRLRLGARRVYVPKRLSQP